MTGYVADLFNDLSTKAIPVKLFACYCLMDSRTPSMLPKVLFDTMVHCSKEYVEDDFKTKCLVALPGYSISDYRITEIPLVEIEKVYLDNV